MCCDCNKNGRFFFEFRKIVHIFAPHLRNDAVKGEYQSGQMGQTVNLLTYVFGGSNPSSPTMKVKKCGSSSVDRALAFQAEGRGFEPRLPLHEENQKWFSSFFCCWVGKFKPAK